MRLSCTVFLLTLSLLCFAQSKSSKKDIAKVGQSVSRTEVEAQLSFLAADEMRGRNTGSPELNIAANYIVSKFRELGVKPVPGNTSYFQDLTGLEKITAPSHAELTIGSDVFLLKDEVLMLTGSSQGLEGEMVFVGYGTPDDFKAIDVKDKIAVAYAGTMESKSAGTAIFSESPRKRQLAIQSGALALVEVMAIPAAPWPAIANFVGVDRIGFAAEKPGFCHLLLKNSERSGLVSLIQSKSGKGKISLQVKPSQAINTKNVVGVIEGSDPALKEEWIAVTAHYDHVGVKHTAGADSIFNGARDNAIGTVGILQAAKFLSANKPKRSVVLIALTAEEIGLVGSKWYAEHPLIPLNKTVFNFNCDGAGYNDKTIATIIDFNHTTSDDLLRNACTAFGLTLQGDPAKEQNLYERSDNYNFAAKGVPAVNFSPGVKAFDQELFKYYHQPADEVATLDFEYLEKFYKAFVYSVQLLTNTSTRPTWVKGDKFEAAGNALYSK